MPRKHSAQKKPLAEQFPPSAPYGCAVCLSFCARPGWWTVAEAARAAASGLAPDRSFGVRAPALRGNEGALVAPDGSSPPARPAGAQAARESAAESLIFP